MYSIHFKNAIGSTIDWTRRHIGFYDGIFFGALVIAITIPEPYSNFFFGVMAYGAINAVVKNARPTVTVIVPRQGDLKVMSE